MPQFAQSPIPVHPSDVACIDFVNSAFTDHLGSAAGRDRLGSAEWQEWFLNRYRLKPESRDAAPLEELLALRHDLRRILEKWSRGLALSPRDVRLLDSRISAAPARPRLAGGGARLELAYEPLRRNWA